MSKRIVQIYSANPFSTAVPESTDTIFEWEQKDTSGNIRTYRKFSNGSTAVVPQGGGGSGGTQDLSEYYKSTEVDALLLQKAGTGAVALLGSSVDLLGSNVETIMEGLDTLGTEVIEQGATIEALGSNVTSHDTSINALGSGLISLGSSLASLDANSVKGIVATFSEGNNTAFFGASTSSNIVTLEVKFPKCTATGGGGSVTVDTAMNATSTNPVQNKAIYEQFQAFQTAITGLTTTLSSKQDAPSAAGVAGQVLGLDANLHPTWINQSSGGGTGTGGGGGGMTEDEVTAIAMQQALIFG